MFCTIDFSLSEEEESSSEAEQSEEESEEKSEELVIGTKPNDITPMEHQITLGTS